MENQVTQNFWQFVHLSNKTFSAFCNHVEAAGKTCKPNEIAIGTNNKALHENAMLKKLELKRTSSK